MHPREFFPLRSANQYPVLFLFRREEVSSASRAKQSRIGKRSVPPLTSLIVISHLQELELGSGLSTGTGRGWIAMIYEDRRSGAQPDSRDASLIASEPHKSSRLYLGLSLSLSLSLFLSPFSSTRPSLPLSSFSSFFFRCGETPPAHVPRSLLLSPPSSSPSSASYS